MTDRADMSDFGDQTVSTALRIAEEKLRISGWKFTSADIGVEAAKILLALRTTIEQQP